MSSRQEDAVLKRKPAHSNEQAAKKSKAENEESVDEENSNVMEALAHYRAFLDSADQEGGEAGEENEGDVDELFELINILKDSIAKPASVDGSLVDYLKGLTKEGFSVQCIDDLLPILMSLAYLQIGNHAIGMAFTADEKDDKGFFAEKPDHYLCLSLQYFPHNAASASLLANYLRMNMLASVEDICGLYQLAADNACKVRSAAISLLENESVQEEAKEWIELLLLHGVSGSEFADSDEEDEDEDYDQPEKSDVLEKEDIVTESEVEATASFMASLLLSVKGNHTEALPYLNKFGVTHRIHPNVWNGAASIIRSEDRTLLGSNGSHLPLPAVFRPIEGKCPGVLPTKLYNSLCNVFAPGSAYFKESDYENRQYYSFFMDLTKDMGTKPKNVIEDVISNHLLPLAKRALSAEDGERIVGAEWWTHTRHMKANLGHPLHFDTDESLLAKEQKITHPILSSVLYLTGGGQGDYDDSSNTPSPGGSTIVFDQTPDSKKNAQKVWCSQPRNNTFMIFPGDRLHGVLPCPGNENNSAAKSDSEHRLTLMIGFWTRRVPDDMTERTLYGPCGALPPPTDDHTWVNQIAEGYGEGRVFSKDSSIDQSTIASFALPKIFPAWECLPENKSEDDLLHIPGGLDHRYFVHNAPNCFHESLMNKDECF